MRGSQTHRGWMAGLSLLLFVVFLDVVLSGAYVALPELALALCAVLFVYIVVRLALGMFAADPERRRRASRGLIVAAVVPALVLTPTALLWAPPNAAALVVIGTVVWIALSLSYTSFLLERSRRGWEAADGSADAPELSGTPSRRPRLHGRGLHRPAL